MVSQISVAADQPFLLQTNAAGGQGSTSGNASKPFNLFGDDGLTFWDLVDMVNPLQHIPVVGTIYRAITGDQLDPGAKIFGATVLGGPLGAAVSVLDVLVKHNTGRDMGEHAVAALTGKEGAPEIEDKTPGQVAEAMITDDNAFVSMPPVAGFVAGAKNKNTSARPDKYWAGMSALPQAKADFIERAVAYMPKAAPDLGLLKSTDAAAESQAMNLIEAGPFALKPRFSADDAVNIKSAPGAKPIQTASMTGLAATEQILADNKNGWVIDTMMRAMDQYEAGNKLIAPAAVPVQTVVR
ncbi:MAG: hypothetical protein HQ503_06810 [Rhodospirillales bacterium]|nr:hypothetical protein [Rhodospirillales bacterium]